MTKQTKNKIIKIVFAIFCLFGVCVFTAFKFNPSITIKEDDGLYIIKVAQNENLKIYPYVSENLKYNSEIFEQTKAELVINAGYFDTKNQKTTSFVVIDKKTVLNPKENENLLNNEILKPHLDKIFNRSEFRVLNCNGKTVYDITPHYEKVSQNCEIVHSIQAGPMLYPKLTLEEEFFITKENSKVIRDSITAYKKRPRTAVGIKNNYVYIIIATKQKPLTLFEMHDLCRDLKLDKAINFDGGGSTSLNYKGTNNPKYKNLQIVSENDNSARKVKSFLVVDFAF